MSLLNSLGTIGVYAIFAILIVHPVIRDRDKLRERAHNYRDGIYGALTSPFIIILLLTTAIAAVTFAQNHAPFLMWGWLGENIIFAPLTSTTSVGTTGSTNTISNGTSIVSLLFNAVSVFFMLFIIPAMVLFNYEEEKYFRGSYKAVAGWAASHLIMGIPIIAVFPIGITGIAYKLIHDHYGLNTAYAAHLTTNALLLTILGTILLFL